MKIVILVVVIISVIALAQLVRIYELAYKLSGKREEDISYTSNKINAKLFLVFMVSLYVSFIWLVFHSYDGLVLMQPAMSKHGEGINVLFKFNWAILCTVFFITNTLLFVFASKYYDKPGRKAVWFPHSSKLELIWTVVPAVVMAVIIIYGLKMWNSITSKASPDAVKIEIYGEQFKWTTRYDLGNDGLGSSNYILISGDNPLGIIIMPNVKKEIKILNNKIYEQKDFLTSQGEYLPDIKINEINDDIYSWQLHLDELIELQNKMIKADSVEMKKYTSGENDVLVNGEMHLPVNKEIDINFRSKDVIHSAYFPYFRAQMNCVPGMKTFFKFTPIKTTKEMRKAPETIRIMKDINKKRAERGLEPREFDFYLLCNKICGVSHYNMQMKVVIDSEADYEAWLQTLKDKADAVNEDAVQISADSLQQDSSVIANKEITE